MLAALGALAGLLVANGVTRALLGFDQPSNYVPRSLEGALDGRVLAFAAGLTVLTALLFSLVPALHGSKPDLLSGLKGDPAGHGASRLWRWSVRHGLVVIQVALSLVVLIGAGLCVRSLRALQAVDPGLDPSRVVTASVDLAASGYTEARGRQFIADLTGRVQRMPGVESVSAANVVAFSDQFWISGAVPEGHQAQPGQMLAFDFNAVGPDYFRTLGATLAGGREFTAQDSADAPRVAMVNEATARQYWPGQDAIGKRLQRGPQSLEIVGVVRNTRDRGLTRDPRPAIYLPLAQSYTPEVTVHARAAADPQALLAGLRRELQSMDALLPVYNLRTLTEQRDGSLYAERAVAAVLTLFAALALVVATVGIYGVLSYAVTERTREMGIRLAHGAQARDVLALIVGQGMRLTLAGVVLGLAGAFALTRLIQRLLYGVSANDPLTFALIPLGLAGVALLACSVPAWRATRVSPLTSLRHE
jgi:predicted permease